MNQSLMFIETRCKFCIKASYFYIKRNITLIYYIDSSWNTCILEMGVNQQNAMALAGAK